MKKFIYIAIISVLIASCGGGGDEPTPPKEENKPPTTPVQVYPANNDLCIDNAVTFRWSASTDPNSGDTVSYIVEVSESSTFSSIAFSKTVTSTSTTISLEKGVAYYWRIKATDNKNASSAFSGTNAFYTEGEGEVNHVPFAPTLQGPTLSSVVTTATATLEWTASDVDVNDNLVFDVYYGTDALATTRVSENQSGTTFTTATLTDLTDYYWKIVVKDGNGGEAIGQIWNFKTD